MKSKKTETFGSVEEFNWKLNFIGFEPITQFLNVLIHLLN